MATPTLVQHKYLSSTQENGNTFKITLPNPSLGGSATQGDSSNNLLVLSFTADAGAAISSITDDKSNTWTAGPTANSTFANTKLYYAAGAAQGTTVITIVFTATQGQFHAEVTEYYNVATT